MYLTQGLHRSVQVNRHGIATIFGERRRSWAELKDRVSRLAAGLVSLGLQRGDRVAVIALNSDYYVEAYYAVAWAGGVVVPGNTRWALQEHIYSLKDSGARLLLVDRTFAELAAPLAAACPIAATVFLDDDPAPDGLTAVDALIARSAPMADACGTDDELAGLFYTGGTTGHPKGVMLSHRNLVSNSISTAAMAPYPDDPVFLHSPPMFHLADAACIISVTIAGGTHVVVPFFTPENVVQAIEAHGVTAVVLVPTMISMLRDHMAQRPADLSSVRRVVYGASPISETLLGEAMAMFPNANFYQGYGQTELSPAATLLEPRFHRPGENGKSYLRSAGRAVLGVDVRIVGPDMAELPLGEVGEIAARGSGVMLGYWNQPELTRQTIVDGWLRTGDAGYMDDEGFVYLVDRLKDMIVSGGENVFSAEVENALAAHAAISQCAVIGVPDPKWGERVHAIVVLKDGVEAGEEDLMAHCRELIAGYKCPRSVEIRAEPLPLSGAGKIQKNELRKPYWEGQERRIN
ncbi:acyl-CoA synthetase [Chelatococcus reniformis]|uniref:3-methylmercaptopropionyl-CoA ligase n=1 Tax=Chelatococcus reniformis TaxID=1494448 RepID=A0A916U549_9HYPH|nr:long-chain fatty acid--CoA ligase [Chelatococcus reniformis]GGC59329.1 fatty-acid--CoA ligase [Chelatococcus reniformis]